jgi:HK97 family phage prohead protease
MSKTLERTSPSLEARRAAGRRGALHRLRRGVRQRGQGERRHRAGAVTKTLQENPEVPIFWVHNYVKVPIGIGRLTRDGKKGVRIEGELFLETSELAREVFGAMKAGAVKGLSIGYNTLKRTFKGAVRHLQEIAIGEVSLCPFPMNPLAEVDGVKDLYGYEQTEGVGCLLTMIRAGADFLTGEVAEGDTADAGRMQSILNSLAKLLASEIAEVATEDDDGENPNTGGVDEQAYEEAMSATVDTAIKNLEALRTLPEPDAESTPEDDGAASKDDAEPVASTLRALMADIKSAKNDN